MLERQLKAYKIRSSMLSISERITNELTIALKLKGQWQKVLYITQESKQKKDFYCACKNSDQNHSLYINWFQCKHSQEQIKQDACGQNQKQEFIIIVLVSQHNNAWTNYIDLFIRATLKHLISLNTVKQMQEKSCKIFQWKSVISMQNETMSSII